MLRGILFHLAPTVAELREVRELLNTLKKVEIGYAISSTCLSLSTFDEDFLSSSSSTIKDILAQPSKHCLVITDSPSGIASARAAKLPCIGYAPTESTEDMSGAYALFEDFASIDVAYLCRTHAHAVGYPAEILSTERLFIREFSEEDFPALYAMCTKPSTASFMEEILSDYETEQEKHAAYIRTVYPVFDLALWGVFEKASGKLIGRAGFSLPDDTSDTFSLGYLIDVPYRGCGYAKELIPALLSYAKEQGYTEISARIKKENIASVRVLEQCGFPYECKEEAAKGILIYLIHLIM